jgi:hypothetical protein
MPKDIVVNGKRYAVLIGSAPDSMYMEVTDTDSSKFVLGMTQDDETGARTLTTLDSPLPVELVKQAMEIFDSEVEWPIPEV